MLNQTIDMYNISITIQSTYSLIALILDPDLKPSFIYFFYNNFLNYFKNQIEHFLFIIPHEKFSHIPNLELIGNPLRVNLINILEQLYPLLSSDNLTISHFRFLTARKLVNFTSYLPINTIPLMISSFYNYFYFISTQLWFPTILSIVFLTISLMIFQKSQDFKLSTIKGAYMVLKHETKNNPQLFSKVISLLNQTNLLYIEEIPIGALILNEEDRIISCNSKSLDFCKYSQQQIIGQLLKDIFQNIDSNQIFQFSNSKFALIQYDSFLKFKLILIHDITDYYLANKNYNDLKFSLTKNINLLPLKDNFYILLIQFEKINKNLSENLFNIENKFKEIKRISIGGHLYQLIIDFNINFNNLNLFLIEILNNTKPNSLIINYGLTTIFSIDQFNLFYICSGLSYKKSFKFLGKTEKNNIYIDKNIISIFSNIQYENYNIQMF